MLFVGTSIIHHSTEGVFLLCNILDLLIYSFLLFLELFFLESHYNRPIQKIIEGFLIFYTLILIIIYTISYFNSNWVSKWGEDNVLILNKMVLALLIVFGVMAFVVKAFESERKEGPVKC